VGITLGAAFAASIGLKIANLVKGIAGLFSKGAQVVATDANTVALEENTAALLGKSGGGLSSKINPMKIPEVAKWMGPITFIAAGGLALTYAGSQGKTWNQMTKQQQLQSRSPAEMFGQSGAGGSTRNTVRVRVTN
jgi:hypothetical protein